MNNSDCIKQEDTHAIRVIDEYYPDLPDDLYIPPEAFAILLEQFEGPLDFLLYLVKKNGFDLKTLDIAPIARQYLSYMEKMKSLNIELTADYMVMAALLADLKSRLLLPKPENNSSLEHDPKKLLVDRLEQYLTIKQAAERLGQFNILERDVFDAQVSLGERGIIYEGYNAQSLQDALTCIFTRPDPMIHQVEHEPVLLEERMHYICEKVASGGILGFTELLNPLQGRMGMVVTFMAILELVKQQQISIVHDGNQHALSIQGKYYA
ncbi:segregation/condensation protein A [Acinetobacter qingfengensis]|uniref:Segregation and condensation protein A n=1 Tax=Acinetobacter qingfengensis TaxID=1262585 RepID=A0A1E7RCT5_9GAMM|nr:segregation/condensation protein A [Acinetobacter qingfengensis]KAA8734340.1 segregation/condensation protein A [Acinetobacter qingfengensis]OEY97103.1 serine protease [Acinetobacter qingfengensis]